MSMIKEFLRLEAAAGILLVAAAVLALVVDNSPINWLYEALLTTTVAIQVGALEISKPLLLWINDGLMAIFFLLVGLEIKREVLDGELSSWSQAALPGAAAVGGMVVPAAFYIAVNWGDAETLRGWAIPAATDIAFALGVLALLGKRVPATLKIFLLAVAIIDDLGAIVIIAMFYTAELSVVSLGLAVVGVIGLIALNLLGVTRIAAYVVIGIFLWICVLKSGVHATLAGVAIGFAIPLRARDEEGHCPLTHLEHALHPCVSYGILPVFAFANAGVSFEGLSLESLLEPIALGIAGGLFLGKQIGVLGFTVIAVLLGLCNKPEGTRWAQFYGIALLTGIGFTMSLFIGTLAFEDGDLHAASVRLGVLTGSLLSGVGGYLVLRLASPSAAAAVSEAGS